MSEPFVAEIRIFAGNFAPRSWAFCNGQLLPISQNTALFCFQLSTRPAPRNRGSGGFHLTLQIFAIADQAA